ncbi:hypothetical protein AAG570_010036 [Ranatra chinensis]|uniref:ZP domain-containing protein n=1 Tax=Ranatra chinensis TaxID=642074 RepID=A0ABD0YLD9_9HEMI
MEVRGSAASSHQPSAPLSVGQHTTLAIYTSLPEGITSQPVDCGVHDGHGSRQSLSDRQGCPTDPSLVPRLRQDVSGTHATWATAFPAFSFPDYQLVHYTCRLRLCKNYCPTVNSSKEGEDEEYMEISDEGNILDVVELYNSIEVTAPNIELGYLRRQLAENADGESVNNIFL